MAKPHFSLWRRLLSYSVMVMGASVIFTGCTITLPSLGKNNSGLQVITNDATASLFLDGQYLDKTPYISKQIKPGSYTLKIQPDAPNLVVYETTVTLRRGLLTVVTWKPGERAETSGGVVYEMEPLKGTNKAELSFVTIPDNAIIKLDEREQQFSPLVITELEPGLHNYEVALPSYETQKHTINALPGHRIIITLKLAKSSGEADSIGTPTTPATPSPNPSTSPTVPAGSPDSTPVSTFSGRTTPTTTVSGPKVTIGKTNFFNNGQEVLRVRDSASNGGKELGFAPVDSQYVYLGETQSGWYKISFNGQIGWVSTQFSRLSQ